MKKVLFSALVLLALAGTGSAQTLPSYVPANGLVGWWPFNGNANDESGNNNNGTVNGATLTADRFGNAGKAFSFDGVDDKISIAPSSSLNNFNNSITISAWIYSVGKGSPSYGNQDLQGIFGPATWLVDDGGFLFRLYDDVYDDVNQRVIQCGNGLPTFPIFSSQVVQTNSWENITYSYDGNRIRLYRNGIKTDSSAVGGGLTSSMNTGGRFYTIGQCIDWASTTVIQAFNGKLDDIAIYNRALSQQEITSLYQGANTTSNCPTFPASLAQGLVGYWPFCGNANDESGNNNHGTVNGATLTTDRFGNAGSAYGFDGNNDGILINNSNTSGDFSFTSWMNPEEINGRHTISSTLITTQNFPNGWELVLDSTASGDSLVIGNGSIGKYAKVVEKNKWVNTALVYYSSEQTMKFYVNGILIQEQPNFILNNQSLKVGIGFRSNYPNTPNNYFNGSLDDIAIWNRALTPQEIQQVYNQGICQTSITVTDTLLIHTGITSYNPVAYGNTLKVWPNPTNTQITLDAGNLSSMQGWKYKVANGLGQTVVNETAIIQQQTNISLSTWGGNGIYYLHLINPQGIAVEIKKIVLAP
jgi:hypothetical protein